MGNLDVFFILTLLKVKYRLGRIKAIRNDLNVNDINNVVS